MSAAFLRLSVAALLAGCVPQTDKTAQIPAGQPTVPRGVPVGADDIASRLDQDTLDLLARGAPAEQFSVTALDGTLPMDSDLVCLARTVYFESRGLGRTDQAAVAHVVLNRVRHQDYPGTICDVVKDGGAERPCQFSWYCDGRSDTPGNRPEYEAAIRVAHGVLNGEIDDPTDGANMFHNTSVNPRWARVAELKTRIGRHLFYYLRRR
ncbi:MAG: cell wall hydrolase [Pseudomonadota bacterium]